MRVTIEQAFEGAKAAASRGDSVVIVDVLRASTTYATALASGAARIVPCAGRADLEQKRREYPDALRAGERQCRRIDGYDLGSSPTEMAAAPLQGRTILSTTTNGSRMVVAAAGAPLTAMGGFCNGSAVADLLRERAGDVSLVCAGRMGQPVIEDWLGALWLAHLLHGCDPQEFPMSPEMIREACTRSPSYGALQAAGLLQDFDCCLAFDSLAVVPVLKGDGFVKAQPRKLQIPRGP